MASKRTIRRRSYESALEDKVLVLVEHSTPSASLTLDGRVITEKDARALFDRFRQAEALLQKYIAKFPDYSRERYLLLSRYHSQLKRWLKHRDSPQKFPNHSAWRK